MSFESLLPDYERDGVVSLRGFWSPAKVAEVRQSIARYTREILPGVPNSDRVFEADGVSVRNLWRLEAHDPYFRDLLTDRDTCRLISLYVHGEVACRGVETFNKPAGTGSGVPRHQDNAYFCQTPPDMLTLWIALDPVTEENGPVTYHKGSHKTLLPHEPSGVRGNSYGLARDVAVDESTRYVATLDPGDALIHHCQIIHESAPNTTSQPRLGLLMVYRGKHTKQDDEKKAAYDKALALTNPNG